jgi:hypothetical protein
MIADHDRSGFFGASDTEKVIAKNIHTKTWEMWWQEKLGIRRSNVTTPAMAAGTNWEHKILEVMNVPGMVLDRQVLLPEWLLRVNLDGDNGDCIYECKTHAADKPWKAVPKHYLHQVQVQMYASGIRQAYIVEYPLIEAEYNNYFLPVDPQRIKTHRVEYDHQFIQGVYLPRLAVLARALKEGRFPIGI